MIKRTIAAFVIILTPLFLNPLAGQDVPHPVANTGVYEFLDELAGLQIIAINSAVKPYSRLLISEKLREADGRREKLTARQQKELDFYLKDFGKEFKTGKDWKRRIDLYYHSDSLFSLTINPVAGGEMFSNSEGNASYFRNGVEARAYVGKFGFYASLRDNHEKPLLGKPEYLTKREGGHLKGVGDWSEMKGGITWAWKWGSIGLIKDKTEWGSNYNGAAIQGGRNPSFVQLKLHVAPAKWFDFNYIHGWLNSMVVDSSESYWVTNSYGTDYREVYHKKFIAANIFTLTPFRNLNVSAGNSIVYTGDSASPMYLIPVLFYKSVDHAYTSGIDNMNSQMFIDISSRQIRKVHLYGTLFIDELSTARFTRDDEWNFFCWKTGVHLTDLPVRNMSLTAEFTYTYPLTFMHYVPTTTYENVGYNLGHYLKDNAREFFAAVDYRPLRAMKISLFFSDAVRGPDYTALGTNRVGNPPLESVEWHNTSAGASASWQPLNDLYAWISFVSGNITGKADWTAPYFYGQKNTINLGLTAGF